MVFIGNYTFPIFSVGWDWLHWPLDPQRIASIDNGWMDLLYQSGDIINIWLGHCCQHYLATKPNDTKE